MPYETLARKPLYTVQHLYGYASHILRHVSRETWQSEWEPLLYKIQAICDYKYSWFTSSKIITQLCVESKIGILDKQPLWRFNKFESLYCPALMQAC